MNNSIRLWFVGGEVDCTTKTSSPRTFSSIFTNVSPSGNASTVHLPTSMPIDLAIALASGGFDVPVKIFTLQSQRLQTKNPPAGGRLRKSRRTVAVMTPHASAILAGDRSYPNKVGTDRRAVRSGLLTDCGRASVPASRFHRGAPCARERNVASNALSVSGLTSRLGTW